MRVEWRRGCRGLAATLAGLMLAACVEQGSEPAGALAGAAAEAQGREDGPVVVVPYGSGYLAAQTVALSGDTAGVTRAEVTLGTAIGDVVTAAGADGYRIEIALQASGPSEAEARKALASMAVEYSDRRRGGALLLRANVRFRDYRAPRSTGPVQVEGSVRRAQVHGVLPASLAYALRQSTDIGNVGAAGLGGPSADFDTDIGDATLQGTWGKVSLTSDIGDLVFGGDAAVLEAVTDIGSVYATLSGERGTQADLVSNIGDVDVGLPVASADAGFDLLAQTDIGSALIVVRGTQPEGQQQPNRARFRTPGYANSSPRIAVRGYSDIGSVTIHD